MAPVWRNGVLLKGTGPDSGERRVGKHAHSAPGRDATNTPQELAHLVEDMSQVSSAGIMESSELESFSSVSSEPDNSIKDPDYNPKQ